MKFNISPEAAQWFKEELDLQDGDYVQFIVKIYGGIPTAHPNYYLGILIGKNDSIGVKQEVEGITFYFSEQDKWFLDDYEMEVVYNNGEVEYKFQEK